MREKGRSISVQKTHNPLRGGKGKRASAPRLAVLPDPPAHRGALGEPFLGFHLVAPAGQPSAVELGVTELQ